MNALRMVLFFTVASLFGACSTTSLPLGTPTDADKEAAMHNDEGIQSYRQGQWEEAKEHFEDAIMADPDLAEPHYNLALTLDQLGFQVEATRHFNQGAALAPTNTAITGSQAYTRHTETHQRDFGSRYGGMGGN